MELMFPVICLFCLFDIIMLQHISVNNAKNIIVNSAVNDIQNGDIDSDYDCVIYGCTQGSYCDYSIPKCVCRSNYVRVGSICLIKAHLGQHCIDSQQCQADNTVCIRNKCTCQSGYKSSGFSCYRPKSLLGQYCSDSQQCQEDNTVCIRNKCTCQSGYESSGFSCYKSIQKPKFDIFLFILSALSVIIIGVAIIVSVFAIRKKIIAARSRRTEISTVQLPSESNISNRGQESHLQTVGSRCSVAEITVTLDMDKPPSYEEVMRSSTYNLVNPEASFLGQSNPGFVR